MPRHQLRPLPRMRWRTAGLEEESLSVVGASSASESPPATLSLSTEHAVDDDEAPLESSSAEAASSQPAMPLSMGGPAG